MKSVPDLDSFHKPPSGSAGIPSSCATRCRKAKTCVPKARLQGWKSPEPDEYPSIYHCWLDNPLVFEWYETEGVCPPKTRHSNGTLLEQLIHLQTVDFVFIAMSLHKWYQHLPGSMVNFPASYVRLSQGPLLRGLHAWCNYAVPILRPIASVSSFSISVDIPKQPESIPT